MNCQFFAAEANGDITISVHNNDLNVGIHSPSLSADSVNGVAIICLDKNVTSVEAAKDLVHRLTIDHSLRFTFGEVAYKNFQSMRR